MAMLAKRFLLASLLIVCCLTVAADEELPEIEFLEYLGLWEESDDEWVMFSDPILAENKPPQRIEPAPQGEASTETDDED